MQTHAVGLQPQHIRAHVLVMRPTRLQLLGDRMDVAEAALEGSVFENRVGARQAIGGVHHGRRLVRRMC